jgi:phosphatidate cytidylyltransferase
LELTPKTSHGKRFVTAALIVPLLFAYLYWGGSLLFVLLVWAGFSVGNHEFFRLVNPGGSKVLLGIHWLMGTVTVWATCWKGLEGLIITLVAGSLISMTLIVLSYPNQKPFYDHLGRQLFTQWYLPFYLPFFILIRQESMGLYWFFFLLAVNYAGDTGAFYVGRTWGRHKLAPQVSPKKTIEGSLGGLAANLLVALIFQQTLFKQYPWFQIALLGVVLGAVSQIGDLLESVFKRAARIKDSGTLFPGHGGLLDRVDSLLLPAPLLYFFLHFWGTK